MKTGEAIRLGLILAPVLAGFFPTTALYRRLKENHPNTWIMLGRPSFWNNTLSMAIAQARYFYFSSDYKSLNDPAVDHYVAIIRTLVLVVTAILALFAVDMFLGPFFNV